MKNEKIYEVFLQDEWNNLTLFGFYERLCDSVNDINDYISNTYNVTISENDLQERAGTFGSVFDTDLGDIFPDNEELCGIMIRGFILYKDNMKVIKAQKKGGH